MEKRGPVATLRHLHHPCPERLRQRLRAVGAAIVGDDDFRLDARARNPGVRFAYAGAQGLGLVQAWHENGQLHGSPFLSKTKTLLSPSWNEDRETSRTCPEANSVRRPGSKP